MPLAAIPPHLPFLDTLAERWLADTTLDPSDGILLLPGRRAARSLADAFLRVSGGRPMLLPRIAGIAALDEAPLLLDGMLDLPPAMPEPRRLALLTRLILALDGQFGAPRTVDRAWPLAREHARRMDEAEQAGISLADTLPHAADPAFSVHWQKTLQFLQIVTATWPEVLDAEGMMNPAARLVALLEGQATRWTEHPPGGRVWAAGFAGGIPALFGLLRVVAALPNGLVVVPGLDAVMDEASWQKLAPSHPQDGLRRMLTGAGLARGEAGHLNKEPTRFARAELLRQALLPADQLGSWRASPVTPAAVEGLTRLTAADEQEEALAIALVLRAAIETPGAQAALVTPDRALALRVATCLRRFGIIADDSAGTPLAASPPAAFLRLVAEAWQDGLAPVPLLALLKHPFAALGLAPAECRDRARRLDRDHLRGPRPGPGIAALEQGLRRPTREDEEQAPEPPADMRDLVHRLGAALAPLDALPTQPDPLALLTALIQSAEAIATTDAAEGAARLWSGADGEALSGHLAGLLAAMPALGAARADAPPEQPAALLDSLLEGAVVRDARREGGAAHSRIVIWGLLEARLQSADLVVLGGLVEGVWPPATDPGPWLSRPMRAAIGLPPPEELVGVAALDFLLGACAAPAVILSCPTRRERAPAVPARWLARLEARLAGAQLTLPQHPAAAWARLLDQPIKVEPARPPEPQPPVAWRPRSLSVTEIETWQRDPYAIYARHILHLRKLDDLDAQADAADYGSLVHEGLGRFLRAHGAELPGDAAHRLEHFLQVAMSTASLRPVLIAWWRPRLKRIAAWVAAQDTAWRGTFQPTTILAECSGETLFDGPAGPFTLRGRADRIDLNAAGEIAVFDYKTGTPPSLADARNGRSPQLSLEALMARNGAFGPSGSPRELLYWKLGGGFIAGQSVKITNGKTTAPALVDAIEARLRFLIERYDDERLPYLAQPIPNFAPRFADYGQLARLTEWQSVADEGAASAEITDPVSGDEE